MHQLFIHYQVEEHYVRAETFLAGVTAAQKSLNSINGLYFGGQLQPDILVLPPQPGTLLQRIGLRIRQGTFAVGLAYTAVWSVVQLIDSSFVQEISVELIGQTPTEYIIQRIRRLKELEEIGEVSGKEIEEQAQDILEEFVSQSAQRNLELPRGSLERSKIPEQLRFDLEDAQSELFRAALNDPEVRAIGFSEEDDFPIGRNEFAVRAVRPRPPRLVSEPDKEWIVSTRQILVTSPNFDREDQAYRKWKGRDLSGTGLLFEIADEEFWLKLHRHELEFSEDTSIKVQLVTCKVDGRISNHRALRVLEVDGHEIAKPLNDEALRGVLGEFRLADSNSGMPDLFG